MKLNQKDWIINLTNISQFKIFVNMVSAHVLRIHVIFYK